MKVMRVIFGIEKGGMRFKGVVWEREGGNSKIIICTPLIH
jgi:hypothetical protein